MAERKSFTTYITIPKSLQKGHKHIWSIRHVFSSLCEQTILDAHKASVAIRDNKRGKRYAFTVLWGLGKKNQEATLSVVRDLAQATVYKVKSDNYLNIIEDLTEGAKNLYSENCTISRPRIIVKPREHIKLC